MKLRGNRERGLVCEADSAPSAQAAKREQTPQHVTGRLMGLQQPDPLALQIDQAGAPHVVAVLRACGQQLHPRGKQRLGGSRVAPVHGDQIAAQGDRSHLTLQRHGASAVHVDAQVHGELARPAEGRGLFGPPDELGRVVDVRLRRVSARRPQGEESLGSERPALALACASDRLIVSLGARGFEGGPQDPVAHLPGGEPVELHRLPVVDAAVILLGYPYSQRAEDQLGRMAQSVDERRNRDRGLLRWIELLVVAEGVDAPVTRGKKGLAESSGAAVEGRPREEAGALVVAEAFRTEGLQSVIDDHVGAGGERFARRTTWGGGEAEVDGVEDVGHGSGRGYFCVGVRVACAVQHHEVRARRHERLEDQVTVFVARIPVAGHPPGASQVDTAVVRRAREAAVIHAEQAHDAERHIAHGLQRADRDRAGDVSISLPRHVEPAVEDATDHRERDVAFERAGLVPQGFERLDDLLAEPRGGRRHGGEIVARQGERIDPPGHGARSAQGTHVRNDRPHRCGEAAEEQAAFGVESATPLPAVRRHDVDAAAGLQQLVVGLHHHAEGQATQAEQPGVVVVVGLSRGIAIGCVGAPADTRFHGPLLHSGHLLLGELCAPADGEQPHQVEHRRSGHASFGHLEQAQERIGEGVDASQGAIGDLHGDLRAAVGAPGMVGPALVGPLLEHGLNQRRECLDVGSHHHDLAGSDVVPIEQIEQHVAQHLDLTRRAVTGVHLHGVVAAIEHALRTQLAHRVHRDEPEDVVLEMREQASRGRHAAARFRARGRGFAGVGSVVEQDGLHLERHGTQ